MSKPSSTVSLPPSRVRAFFLSARVPPRSATLFLPFTRSSEYELLLYLEVHDRLSFSLSLSLALYLARARSSPRARAALFPRCTDGSVRPIPITANVLEVTNTSSLASRENSDVCRLRCFSRTPFCYGRIVFIAVYAGRERDRERGQVDATVFTTCYTSPITLVCTLRTIPIVVFASTLAYSRLRSPPARKYLPLFQ